MQSESSIKVGIRSRPLAANELINGCQPCVIFPSDNPNVVELGKTKSFSFDYAFSECCSQQEIYDKSVKSLIENLFIGYNITVFAYGQTGSGKTHTMGTNCSDNEINEYTGIIPRAVKDIFSYLNNLTDNCKYTVTTSFIEIYNDEIYDLLSEQKEWRCIREENEIVKIPNLSEIGVTSFEEVFHHLKKGGEIRAVGSTAMNLTSSRSHAIFTLYINIIPKDNDTEPVFAKLHLVDLAGSEKAGKTKATGDRLKEGININGSLFVLGRVINALVDKEKLKNKKSVHIPYRDSKLTRILQDSLGGNTKTLMLACISPADMNFEETASTLNYAARARQIQNIPVMNRIDPSQGEVYRLRSQIVALETEVKRLKRDKSEISEPVYDVNSGLMRELKDKETEIVKLQKEKLQVMEEHDEEISKFTDFTRKLIEKIDENKELIGDEFSCLIAEYERNFGENSSQEEEEGEQTSSTTTTTTTNTNAITNTNTTNLSNLDILRQELANKENDLKNIERDFQVVTEYEEKKREYEQRIKELEEEQRKNQTDTIKSQYNTSLAQMRSQLNQLNELKREKEKKTEEVNRLRNKIQELKSTIVRVERDMKRERTQYKKELADTKKQSKLIELKDKQTIYKMERAAEKAHKENVVLKRKYEHIQAEEKRTKKLLDKRRKIVTSRIDRAGRTYGSNFDARKHVHYWLKESLEAITNQYEIKNRYEKLLAQRKNLNHKIRNFGDEVDPEQRASDEAELNRLNKCLVELQSGIDEEGEDDFDNIVIDHEQNLLMNNIWNQLKNTGDYKAAILVIFVRIIRERKKLIFERMRNEDLEAEKKVIEEGYLNMKEQLEIMKSSINSKKSTRGRKSSLITIVSNDDGPVLKKQRSMSDISSDNESMSSRKSRSNNGCRCKSMCRSNRCGCSKNNQKCSIKCSCKGACSDLITTTIEEDDKENIMESDTENKLNVTVNMIDDSEVQNKPEIFSESSEDSQMDTTPPKDNLFTEFNSQ